MKPALLILLAPIYATSAMANGEFKIKNRLLIDADYFGPYYQKGSDENSSFNSEFELASLKSSISYSLDNLKAKLQLEYTKEAKDDHEGTFEVKDAYIQWEAGSSELTFGRFKEPMGYEKLTSTTDLSSIERSMVTSAFSPGRNLGVQYFIGSENTSFSMALVKIEDDDFEDGYASTLRGTFHSQNFNMLAIEHFHLGGGYSVRDLNNSLYQIKERGEINTADNIIRSARFYTKEQTILQGEIGASWSDYWLMAEWYQSQFTQTDDTTWQYQGFYVQLTGQLDLFNRSNKKSYYGYKNHEFKIPKHHKNDMEWVIRYSGITLRDNDIGSEASSLLLGLNYYFSKNTRSMLDVLLPDISGSVVNTNQDGYAVSLRLSHEF